MRFWTEATALSFLIFALTCLPAAGQLPALSVQTHTALPKAFVGQPYQLQLQGRGGAEPYKWRIAKGSFPKGLNLQPDGKLLGTPREAGEFPFTVTVEDSASPAQQLNKDFVLRILTPLFAQWGRYPVVSGQRIDGSVKISNETDQDFDLTFVVVAVNENGRATALGYQRFTLKPGTFDMEIPFGENLPYGSYQVNVDAVGEVAALNRIHRARLVTGDRLTIVQQP